MDATFVRKILFPRSVSGRLSSHRCYVYMILQMADNYIVFNVLTIFSVIFKLYFILIETKC